MAELLHSVVDRFKPLYGRFILADEDGPTVDSEEPWVMGESWCDATDNLLLIESSVRDDPYGLAIAGFRFEIWDSEPATQEEDWDRQLVSDFKSTSGRLRLADSEGMASPAEVNLGLSDTRWSVRAFVRTLQLAPAVMQNYRLGVEEYEAEIFLLQFWPRNS